MMLRQDESVQTLIDLGLTVLQAKVYIAMYKSDESTGRGIAKAAKVAPQDVYRILVELQEKGLVEKILGRPNKYSPLPMQNVLSFLLKHKEHEYKEIEKKTEKLYDEFKTRLPQNDLGKKSRFLMITTKDANISRIKKSVLTTKRSVDVIDSWVSFKHAITIYEEHILEGVKKNVKFRFITNEPEDGESIPENVRAWKKEGWVELKHISARPPTAIRIEDQEKVSFCITHARHRLEAPGLFSDNPCFVAIMQDYFEMLWNKAT